jgi:Putative zinc-finger
MLTMNCCADVRRELSAYQDEELSIGARIAIADHLENCPACRVEADDLKVISETLQREGRAGHRTCGPALSRAQSDIVERLAAEESVSFATWIGELLEDRRRAFTTTGASLAACLLLLVIAGVCQLGLGAKGHPDSLAAMLEREEAVWAARSETPVLLPRVNPETIMPTAVVNQGDGEESYSAFAALVTSDGNLSELEFLGDEQALTKRPAVSQKQLESDLLAAAATASFQPASKAGEPVPLNVVWIVTHRTVRARTMHARVEVTSTFRIG